ncbi:MAG: hypothetical protein NVS2B14_21920 [Chamaesiphon sp.]
MPAQLRRTQVVKIRLNLEEYAKAERMALEQGMTLSELFRQRTLKRQPIRINTISKQVFLKLGQLNASFKLIAQAAKIIINSGQPSVLSPNLLAELEESKKLIKKVHAELIDSNPTNEELSEPASNKKLEAS